MKKVFINFYVESSFKFFFFFCRVKFSNCSWVYLISSDMVYLALAFAFFLSQTFQLPHKIVNAHLSLNFIAFTPVLLEISRLIKFWCAFVEFSSMKVPENHKITAIKLVERLNSYFCDNIIKGENLMLLLNKTSMPCIFYSLFEIDSFVAF